MDAPLHPKAPQGLSRREFFRRSAVAAAAFPTLSAILAACGSGAQSTVGGGPSGSISTSNKYGSGGVAGAPYPLARPDAPVTWNILSDNRPIANNLPPETDQLQIYNWPYYLSPSICKAFGKKYNVPTPQITTFPDLAPGVAKLVSGQANFDMMFGLQIYDVGKLIAGGLIQPLNLEYVPNFQANVWTSMQSMFYDVNSHFTLPYCVWNTGIMWRNDFVKQDIAGMSNPWDIFWNGAPKNKTHLLSNPRDPLAMAMYWRGETDPNTSDPAKINQARDDILTVVKNTNAQFDHLDYQDIPKGQAWLHQSWSGNVGSAFYFLPKGDTAPNISYYWPGATTNVPASVDNDTMVVLKGAKNPVLAHLFMNFLLEPSNALQNYVTYTGYQMPQQSITPDSLVGSQAVPSHLASTVVTETQFNTGLRICELSPGIETLYDGAYQQILAGVK
jgi:spermidine/putrescine transport system substrate-binding protein